MRFPRKQHFFGGLSSPIGELSQRNALERCATPPSTGHSLALAWAGGPHCKRKRATAHATYQHCNHHHHNNIIIITSLYCQAGAVLQSGAWLLPCELLLCQSCLRLQHILQQRRNTHDSHNVMGFHDLRVTRMI